MKELVEVIAKALVEHPDKVAVTEQTEGSTVKVDLRVDPSDMGKVIGRQGRIARAIRAVVKAAATRDNIAAEVNIDDGTAAESAPSGSEEQDN